MKSFLTVALLFFSMLAQAQHLRILSYNIHHGNPPSQKGVIDLEAIAKVIRESEADLIGIQEVDVRMSRSQRVDQAQKLAELTHSNYFFSKGIDHDGGEYGTLILTKHKIVGQRRYDLPMVEPSENRSLAIVDVELPNGKVVSFANTHLDLKPKNRIAQVAFINELGDWYSRPFILVGDLNAAPTSEALTMLSKYFVRNTTDNGPTFPDVAPHQEIDYILVGQETAFRWKSYTVLQGIHASDHLPLLAEIELL